jgi:hypothetical protein
LRFLAPGFYRAAPVSSFAGLLMLTSTVPAHFRTSQPTLRVAVVSASVRGVLPMRQSKPSSDRLLKPVDCLAASGSLCSSCNSERRGRGRSRQPFGEESAGATQHRDTRHHDRMRIARRLKILSIQTLPQAPAQGQHLNEKGGSRTPEVVQYRRHCDNDCRQAQGAVVWVQK